MEKSSILSGKKLARKATNAPSTSHPTPATHNSEEFAKKREEAKRMAQQKAKAKNMAKQQQLAERIAAAAEQLASGVEDGNAAAQELSQSVNQIAAAAAQSSETTEHSRVAIKQIEALSLRSTELAGDTLRKVANLRNLAVTTSRGIQDLVEGVTETANPTWKKMLQKKPILNKNRRKSKMSKF